MDNFKPCFSKFEKTSKKTLSLIFNDKSEILFDDQKTTFLHERNFNIDQGYKIFEGDTKDIVLFYDDKISNQHDNFVKKAQTFSLLDEEKLKIYARASQLNTWIYKTKYCSRHGTKFENVTDDLGKYCNECGFSHYPKMSPCIMVVVKHKDQILLVQHKNSPQFFTVIAGFVEYGETLYEAVKREVHEEVGLEVSNIRFFESQSWPYPNQLMIAFFAEAKDKNITVDQSELSDAQWYDLDKLPRVPLTTSLSSKLIKASLS